MNVLVTGGSGFIGRNIVKKLKEQGHYVVTLDLKDQTSNSDTHVIGDVRDLKLMINITKNMDFVFHLAAVTAPPEFENLTSEGYEINVMGTYNVMAASAVNHVRRVILASSSSVYGNMIKIARESDLTDKFENFYPLSKRINELTGSVFLNYGLEIVSLRYFNTYGIGENTKGIYASVIWKFIDDIRNDRVPIIYGDGSQSRDFIFVEDAARASILAMEYGKNGETYNIGTGTSTDFNTIFQIIKEEMNYKKEAVYVTNPLKHYQRFTQADLTKTKKDLGFYPEYDIRKGVRKIIETLD
ncbi:MAG: NAD-dependent epimerase/dehydratase family protein [Candidatus Micrarchaeia archaeon]